MKKLVLILLLFLSYTITSAQVFQEYLLSGWTFQVGDKEVSLPAEVPGSLQNDLAINGRNSTNSLSDKVTYRTTFVADEFILAREHIELLFNGLDTKAAIYLNKQLILETNNMFRSWTVPIKSFVKKGDNTLEIVFDTNLSHANSLPIRKAAYHFPSNTNLSQIPVGIWKPIILQSWNDYKLNDVFVSQDSLSGKEALLTAFIEVQGKLNTRIEIEVYDEITDRVYERQEVILSEKNQQIEIPFRIRKPKLWWPVSLGDPDLYTIGVRMTSGPNEQSLIKRIGLRKVDILSTDSIQQMQVHVNGKKLDIHGADYIPTIMLTSHIRSNDYNAFFDRLIKDRINVLRVVGNGIYESDYFYDLADTRGILIIQDFMFSQQEYPITSTFLQNIQAEAKENINLLKQHPSLIIWTVGNELDRDKNNRLVKVLSEAAYKYDASRPFVSSLSTSGWTNSSISKLQ